VCAVNHTEGVMLDKRGLHGSSTPLGETFYGGQGWRPSCISKPPVMQALDTLCMSSTYSPACRGRSPFCAGSPRLRHGNRSATLFQGKHPNCEIRR